MDGALRTFIIGSTAAYGVAYGFRALVYVLSYLAVGDVQNGDLTALDRLRTYDSWAASDLWAIVVGFFVAGWLQRRWADAGNTNALARPDVRLSWLRDLPSSKAFQRWQLTRSLGYLGVILMNIMFSHAVTSPEQVRTWALFQVALCLTVIVASIGVSVSARQLTAQLLQRIGSSEQAVRTPATEPDPVG
jgi:hypothetical protein